MPIRFCQLAEIGRRADWTPSLRNPTAPLFCQLADGRPISREWDTAAGQAIVEGAGGAVLGMDGEPLTYNARDTPAEPPLPCRGRSLPGAVGILD